MSYLAVTLANPITLAATPNLARPALGSCNAPGRQPFFGVSASGWRTLDSDLYVGLRTTTAATNGTFLPLMANNGLKAVII